MTDTNANRQPSEEELRKASAEAAKAEAEAEQVRLQTEYLRNTEARAQQLHEIAVSNNKIAVDSAKADLKFKNITLTRERRKEQALLADDTFNQVYLFDQAVRSDSVDTCIATLTQWMRTKPGCEIEIIFDSPGGSVIDGMHLWDFLNYLKGRGHKITTVAMGMAASMAGILLQAGDTRIMGRESYLLIHEISAGAIGKVSEMEDEVAFCKKIQNRVLKIFSERSAHTLITRDPEKYANTTESLLADEQFKHFKEMWNRKDWWLDSDEAMAEGLIDDVR